MICYFIYFIIVYLFKLFILDFSLYKEDSYVLFNNLIQYTEIITLQFLLTWYQSHVQWPNPSSLLPPAMATAPKNYSIFFVFFLFSYSFSLCFSTLPSPNLRQLFGTYRRRTTCLPLQSQRITNR